ncbi:hypothetical protein ACRU3B_16520 [Mycobacterium colombiense]
MSRRQIIAAALYGAAVYALGFLLLVGLLTLTSCGPAHADPEPAPTPPGYVECNGQLVPVGAVIYRWFLQQMCATETPPAAPPNM